VTSVASNPTVTVVPAPPERQLALANLFQLYAHDFSEFAGDPGPFSLDEDGRFAPYPWLDAYWTEPGRSAWLIRADDRLAGFALINAISPRGAAVDHNMAEFFIARPWRRAGVGSQAAQALISRHRGSWEVAVARRNQPALMFWRRVAAETPGVSALEESEHHASDWDGPILSFRSG
jgi:predicted acetyltransferase